MRYCVLLCVLLLPGTAWAVPLTWEFTGTLAFVYGTVDGSFTYESTAAPNAYNVRGLATNATYILTSWDITVNNTFASIPSPYLVNLPPTMTFSNLLPNNTSEFCIGKCIFSSQPYETLRFSDGEYFLQLAFEIPNAGPFILIPPDTLDDWGIFSGSDRGASSFESPRVVALLTDGGIMGVSFAQSVRVLEPVPEPASWMLLGGGLLALIIARLVSYRSAVADF